MDEASLAAPVRDVDEVEVALCDLVEARGAVDEVAHGSMRSSPDLSTKQSASVDEAVDEASSEAFGYVIAGRAVKAVGAAVAEAAVWVDACGPPDADVSSAVFRASESGSRAAGLTGSRRARGAPTWRCA